MTAKQHFTSEQAQEVADTLGIHFSDVEYDLEQFRHGMDIELEHGTEDEKTNVTNDDPVMTGKIALAHLNEFEDYYDRLDEMEVEAEKYWEEKKGE
ncbi:hypothetical protein KKH43_03590 [Patescibacteria group bacterium]|nr:hypothetical protein [Patescibacteria group bacterium]